MHRSLFKWLTYSIGILFLFTTCAEEIVLDFPFVSLSRENGLVYKDTTLCVGQSFSTKFRFNAGDSKLIELAVYENAELIPTNRVFLNGNAASSNPIALTGGEQSSGLYDIMVVPLETDTMNAYTFRVVDELNQPAAAGVVIDIGTPQIQLIDTPDRISSDASIFIGNPIRLRMELMDCWQDITELQIYEEGVLLPDNQISIKNAIDSSDVFASNPIDFQGENRRQFTYDINILPTEGASDSTSRVYTFQLVNSRNQIAYDTLNILNIEPTALEQTNLSGFLYNQAIEEDNPFTEVGFGGLDLDEGQSVEEDSELAEIQDEGIIIEADSTNTWRMQISVVDTADTQMRPATFLLDQTFESISFREQIIDIFDRSRILGIEEDLPTNRLSDMKKGERVSAAMEVGNVFVIRRAGKYYLIECTNILPDTDGNGDLYEFAIKY